MVLDYSGELANILKDGAINFKILSTRATKIKRKKIKVEIA